jgi:hypothetical protein
MRLIMTCCIEPYDWPSRADERWRAFAQIIDAECTVVHQRPAISFGWCLLIVGVAMIFVSRFTWPAVVMAFVLVGVTSTATMLGVIVGFTTLMAASLQAQLNGKPF